MITRTDVYTQLFKLKKQGIDVEEYLTLMSHSDPTKVPKAVVDFIKSQNVSAKYEFYEYLHKHQKAAVQDLLNTELDVYEKIKVASALITRAMIALKYKNIDESIANELGLEKLSQAITDVLNGASVEVLDAQLDLHRNALRLFLKDNK